MWGEGYKGVVPRKREETLFQMGLYSRVGMPSLQSLSSGAGAEAAGSGSARLARLVTERGLGLGLC